MSAKNTADTPVMSEADETMDTMVQAASVPSLAALIKRGKDAGLIKPMQGYPGSAG